MIFQSGFKSRVKLRDFKSLKRLYLEKLKSTTYRFKRKNSKNYLSKKDEYFELNQ